MYLGLKPVINFSSCGFRPTVDYLMFLGLNPEFIYLKSIGPNPEINFSYCGFKPRFHYFKSLGLDQEINKLGSRSDFYYTMGNKKQVYKGPKGQKVKMSYRSTQGLVISRTYLIWACFLKKVHLVIFSSCGSKSKVSLPFIDLTWSLTIIDTLNAWT